MYVVKHESFFPQKQNSTDNSHFNFMQIIVCLREILNMDSLDYSFRTTTNKKTGNTNYFLAECISKKRL